MLKLPLARAAVVCVAGLQALAGCAGEFDGTGTPPVDDAPVVVLDEDVRRDGETSAPLDAVEPDVAVFDAAPPDAPPVPAGNACEYAFFRKYFDRDNGPELAALRDASFARLVEQTKVLQACGAKISLGGMLSLMIYEGGGAKVAFFNDRCSENSYDKSTSCFHTPKARYSYQYGLAPVHMSNFHPCADVAYTSKMRARLQKALEGAGFAATATEIASVEAQVRTFCPSATATLVDYYILTTHSRFGVPTDTAGNDLKNAGVYPFFTPRVVIDLFFATLGGACGSLTSDEAAIGVFGGGDASYRTAAKQATILKLWRDHRATACD